MVIEFLTFTVAPADHDGWLDADERVWTGFLRTQSGFVSKQTWTDRSHPDRVHVVITWSDEAAWKAIPAATLASVDERMGTWRRPCVERVFDVVGSS